MRGGGVDFRGAVNVLSEQHPSELLYLADEAFRHPVVPELPNLPDGFTLLPSKPGGLALDFIRANLVDPTMLRPVPATAPGPDNDLADKLDHFVERAAADPAARLYAFGQRWGPEPATPDKVFGFSPCNAVDLYEWQPASGYTEASFGARSRRHGQRRSVAVICVDRHSAERISSVWV